MNQNHRDGKILELIVDELVQNQANVSMDSGSPFSMINQEDKSYLNLPGGVIGRLIDFNGSGQPFVNYPQNPNKDPIVAKSTINLCSDDIGKEIVMVFEFSKPDKPIVIGIIKSSAEDLNIKKEKPVIEANVDGKQIVFNAEKEIVLRCGEASITLTRAGKIIIRGAYIISRSTGVNRIKGGSVQIN